jgi:hypothetical protein
MMGTRESLLRGALAGFAGVAVMTAAEKIEQTFTRRPNSYVPAKTLAALMGREPSRYNHHRAFNWTMHWGMGVMLGTVRGLMAEHGIRGPVGSFLFTNFRLLNDQVFENATGVGSPPWTWPIDEQIIDLTHKAIYGFTTGCVADKLIQGPAGTPRPMIPWAERQN